MKTSSRSSKRKDKRSQKRSKKKSRSSREKIKKIKRQDHSVSCSDDEDLVSSSLVSCSSRGDDGRNKKRGRSRDRRSRKDKKRNKRSSLMNESSEDGSPRVKKSKKSKKDRSSGSKKKRNGKKRRRDRSVSSVSSQSRDGSASEQSDDSEGEFKRKDEKVGSKNRKGREKRSGSKRSRHRSKSCSPSSLHSEETSSPKRLKSVIVVLKERDVLEEQKSIRDDRREDEIICEFDDDYPSKSNDSIDGVTGKDAIPNLQDVSSEKRLLDEPNRELVASDVKTLEGLEIQRQGFEGSEGITPHSRVNDPSIGNMSEICSETDGSRHADLEAILRQKALENLLKRQGKLSVKIPADKKGGHDTELKKSSIVNAQYVDQNMLCDEGNIKFMQSVRKVVDDKHMIDDYQNNKSVQKVGKPVHDKYIPRDDGNIKFVQKVGRSVDDVRYTTNLLSYSVDEIDPSKDSDAHLVNMKMETAHLAAKGKVPSNSVNGRPNVSLSMSRNQFLGAKNTWKRQLIPQKDCQKNLIAPTEIKVKDSKQQLTLREDTQPTLSTPQETVSKESTRDSSSPKFDSEISTEKVEAVGPSDPSSFGGQSTNDKMSETDEENQFQQKTMSVMRGGEMVQVSYKVYIPKKPPALARRKLKR